ncbi:hypothetical protein MAR_028331, partial [Mya arenaria]
MIEQKQRGDDSAIARVEVLGVQAELRRAPEVPTDEVEARSETEALEPKDNEIEPQVDHLGVKAEQTSPSTEDITELDEEEGTRTPPPSPIEKLVQEMKDDNIKEAIEQEALKEEQEALKEAQEVEQEPQEEPTKLVEPPRIELTESDTPTGEAFDFEDGGEKVEDTAEMPEEKADAEKLVEEEISESVTEIEEIFQVSEDGVHWKTVKKITTITPRGTTERVEVLGEETAERKDSAIDQLAARLSEPRDDSAPNDRPDGES